MALSQLWLNFDLPERRNPISWLMGTYQHAIFVDWHFKLARPLMRLTTEVDGRQEEVPSFDRAGHPHVRDRYWKTLAFVLRSDDNWRSGNNWRGILNRYVMGWFATIGKPPRTVHVLCRDVQLHTLDLDFGIAEEMEQRPWTPCPTIAWEG